MNKKKKRDYNTCICIIVTCIELLTPMTPRMEISIARGNWRLQWYVIVWVIRGKSVSAKIETHMYVREMNKEKAKGWRGTSTRLYSLTIVQKPLRIRQYFLWIAN